jgi:hypothetical protein
MAERHTPDRKVRVKGNRVIHTTRGGVYKGPEQTQGLSEDAERAIEASPRHVSSHTTDEASTTRKR